MKSVRLLSLGPIASVAVLEFGCMAQSDPVEGEPVRAAWTFAIVALSAPNEERSERIDWTCALVSEAACAIGTKANADAASASPVATAATFVTALEVTVFITVDKKFRRTFNKQVRTHMSTRTFTLPHSARYRPARHGLVGKVDVTSVESLFDFQSTPFRNAYALPEGLLPVYQ